MACQHYVAYLLAVVSLFSKARIQLCPQKMKIINSYAAMPDFEKGESGTNSLMRDNDHHDDDVTQIMTSNQDQAVLASNR